MSRKLAALTVATAIALFGEGAVIVALFGDSDTLGVVIAVGCSGAALLVLAGMTRTSGVLGWALAGLAVAYVIASASWVLLRGHDEAGFAGIAVGLGVGGAIALRWTAPAVLAWRLGAVGAAVAVVLGLERFAEEIGGESGYVLLLPPVVIAAIGAGDLLASAPTPGRRLAVAVGLAAVAGAAGGWIWLEQREEERSLEAARRAQTPRPARVGQERILWRHPVKAGFATGPAVGQGTVVVVDWNGFLRAVDADTGRERWRVKLSAGVRPPTPLVRDGSVYYAGGSRAGLEVFDLRTGRRLWTRVASSEAGASLPAFVAGLAVYADYEHALVAVEPATGRVRWRFVPELDDKAFTGFGDPVRARGLVLVAADVADPGGWELFALDGAFGTREWSVPSAEELVGLEVEGATVTVTTPAGARTLALRDGTPRPPPRLVTFTFGDFSAVRAVERPSGRTRWLYRPGWDANTSEPARAGGTLFVAVNTLDVRGIGGLYALDTATGRLLWRTQLRGGAEHTPAFTPRVVYATSTTACSAFEGCSPELVAIRR